MQKLPFFNKKPKVQPEQKMTQQPKQEAPQQTAPAQQKPNQQAMPNMMPNMPQQMPAQQKPNQQAMPNMMPNMPQQMPAQQKPNQQAMPNMMPNMPQQMPAQQKPNQQAMPNMMPNMTQQMPAQQKPNQQAMPSMMPNMKQQMPAQMTLPTVPVPKDNSMFMGPLKSMKKAQQSPNMNSNMMGQHMENSNVMPQHMKDHDMMGMSMKGENLSDMQDTQVSMVEALNLIKDAVEGETEDRMFYDFLISNATSQKDKEIIKGIRDDEIKHARLFRQLYYDHTGKVIGPEQNVQFERPATYCEGLIKALMGEQNAVRKYRKILFAMKERSHINTLTEIITDEIRHATLYNLLIHNNDCKY